DSTTAARWLRPRSRWARSARSTSRSAGAPWSTFAIAGRATSERSASHGMSRSRSTVAQYVACATARLPVAAWAWARPQLAGKMDDPRQLLEEGRLEELAQDDHPLWRGLALLELKRWPDAARTFEEAPDAGESGTMLELAGAARWLAGEREAAVERWISALEAGYEGPASRLKPPALLIYAGTRLGDERYVLRGTRLLTKTWKPKIQRIWPGPVAGFLLGRIDPKTF